MTERSHFGQAGGLIQGPGEGSLASHPQAITSPVGDQCSRQGPCPRCWWPSDHCSECSPAFQRASFTLHTSTQAACPIVAPGKTELPGKGRVPWSTPLQCLALAASVVMTPGFEASGTSLLKQVIVTLDPGQFRQAATGSTFMHICAGAPLQADGDTSGSLDLHWALPLAASV